MKITNIHFSSIRIVKKISVGINQEYKVNKLNNFSIRIHPNCHLRLLSRIEYSKLNLN